MTQTQTATIANGQSLSTPLKLDDGFKPAAILLPAAFTGTKLTFQVSLDGSAWYNLRIGADVSQQLEITEALPSAAIRMDWFPTWPKWFKVRSGTDTSPTAESAERSISVVLEK